MPAIAVRGFRQGRLFDRQAICDDFGVPTIDPERAPQFQPIEKTTDAVNEEWIDRFLQSVEPRVQDAIDQYRALLWKGARLAAGGLGVCRRAAAGSSSRSK